MTTRRQGGVSPEANAATTRLGPTSASTQGKPGLEDQRVIGGTCDPTSLSISLNFGPSTSPK